MKLRYLLLLAISFLVFIFNLTAQQTSKVKKEKEFLKNCDAIAHAYLERDIKKINSFIHPKKGIYVLYRPSMLYWYTHVSKLAENYSTEQYETNKILVDSALLDYHFPNKDSIQAINRVMFDSKISYSCDSGWNKYVSFVDDVHTPSRISWIIENYLYVEQGLISPKELQSQKNDLKKIKALEKKSRLVVYNQFKNARNESSIGLVFYMTLIDNKWYLSTLDCISDYCEVW